VPAAVTAPSVAVTSETPEAAVAPAQEAVAAAQPAETNSFASAFVAPTVQTPSPASAWQEPVKAPRTVRVVLPAAKPVNFRNGSHLVQQGSFSSPQGARRGWGILAARNPQLRDYRMVITPAVVKGRNFWRVAAAGFDSGTASGMCSTVRNRGGVCFAYAATRVPAGALPGAAQTFAGPQYARRK